MTKNIDEPKYKFGDKFYFYKNMTDSETIALGFKGIVDDVIKTGGKTVYCCDGYGFTHDELKPVVRCYAVLS